MTFQASSSLSGPKVKSGRAAELGISPALGEGGEGIKICMQSNRYSDPRGPLRVTEKIKAVSCRSFRLKMGESANM